MPMTIGQVAQGPGVNVQTVRYYERRGLLPRPPRTESGYRQYNQDTVPRLRFIKRAQELGFSLEEFSYAAFQMDAVNGISRKASGLGRAGLPTVEPSTI